MPVSPLLPYHAADVGILLGLDLPGWERMLTLGRLHGLAGRWHSLLEASGALAAIDESVRRHLWSEHLLSLDRARMARWEADRLLHALQGCDVPLILLKGAAYILAGLPPGMARMISDIDILVPHARLDEVERRLTLHGWRMQPHSVYDDAYYRQWMHELPPMQHSARGAVVDVHHNLLPRTSRLCPDADALIREAQPLPQAGLWVLAPADMVLHSIVHGFYGGEFANCWRDVLDVHELVTHFAATAADFWAALQRRTAQFGFGRPAYYAIEAARRAFGTEVPAEVLVELRAHAPAWPLRATLNWAIRRTLLPALPPTFLERCALRGLYLRSHWVKMPPRMLARHLWTKTRMRRAVPATPA